jgi:hypothetical protein
MLNSQRSEIMRTNRAFHHLRLVALMFSILNPQLSTLFAQGTAFTYQGELREGGAPANGPFDLRFTLFDAFTNGSPVTGTACVEDVQVVNGRFTVLVPFLTPNNGVESFLEIAVRSNALAFVCTNMSGFTTLAPRQCITAVPNATFASAVSVIPMQVRGAIRFNPLANRFEGFNGSYWVSFVVNSNVVPSSTQDFTNSGTFSFVVPNGVFSLGVDLWGAGGGGGGFPTGTAADSCSDTSGAGGSGGGGSGGYMRVSLDVTAGETLTVVVGAGGARGILSPGGMGSASEIRRGATTIVRASGGLGGARGVSVALRQASGGCQGNTSASGGGGGTAEIFAAQVIARLDGIVGGQGKGPSCYRPDPFETYQVFCIGSGGGGAFGRIAPAPLPVTSGVRGGGGDGTSPGASNVQPGESGRARFFWN